MLSRIYAMEMVHRPHPREREAFVPALGRSLDREQIGDGGTHLPLLWGEGRGALLLN